MTTSGQAATGSATGGSARSQADDLDDRQWRPRRGLGVLVRFLSFAIPVVVAAVVVRVAQAVVTRPRTGVGIGVWTVALLALAMVTVRLVDHGSRRLLPLGALLRLSLVFPDHAPSRFGIALRSGSGRALQRALDEAAPVDGYAAPQEAAELLVSLVAALSRHDRLTRGHSERVRAYADLIGEQLHLDEGARAKLHWAALVHDVGKLDVPSEILQKRGRPTDEEWEVLRGHPAASATHLGALSEWLGEWARAASEHHERVDGGGYPLGLRGDEISLAGRIVAVADAYDVMTSARSYKKPHPAARARAELTENAGTQFDPEIVRAFLSVSLRDLSLVMGPLAILTQLPALAQVPLEAATVAVAPAVAGVTATALAFVAPGHALARHHDGSPTAARAVAPAGPVAIRAGGRATRSRRPTPTTASATTGVPGVVGRPGGSGTAPTATTAPSDRSGGISPTTAPGSTPTTRPRSVTTTVPAPVNHPPVANPDTPTGKITSRSGSVDVLANDADPDGNLVRSTLRIVSPPKNTPVKISVVGAQVHYEAPAGYKNNVAFKYEVCDRDGACAQAQVTLSFKVP